MTKTNGNIALVTGSANGIGLAVTKRLIAHGWFVVATDIDAQSLERQLQSEIQSDSAVAVHLDIRQKKEWQQVLDDCFKRHGKLDLLVNNAGIIDPAWVADSSAELIDKQLDVNLRGNMYGTSFGAARMRAQGSGHIINIASLAGVAPVTGLGAYVASKFGLRGYSLAAALELRDDGVWVTVICPDLVDTAMLDRQLEHKEAALSFSASKALKATDVADAVMRALRSHPMEITLPASRGLLAKLSSFAPSLVIGLRKSLTKKGLRKMEEYKKERGV